MVKLFQNSVKSLDSVVMADNGQIGSGAAVLFSVSDLTDFDAKAEDGTPFRRYVWRQWLDVQNNALKPEQRLHPNASISVLADETEPAYTVSGIAVPSKKNKDGFEVVAMTIADVVRLADGEPYLKPWYLPVVRKDSQKAHLTTSEKPKLGDLLFAVSNFSIYGAVAGSKNPFLICDNQCNPTTLASLRKNYGLIVFLKGVRVPSLTANGKELDVPVGEATLFIKPNAAYMRGMPEGKAEEIGVDYLVNGFGVRERSPLVQAFKEQVQANTHNGIFHYGGK